MSPEEIRLKCLELVISKASQAFAVPDVIAKATALTAFVMPDTPQGPDRKTGTLTVLADTAKGTRKP